MSLKSSSPITGLAESKCQEEAEDGDDEADDDEPQKKTATEDNTEGNGKKQESDGLVVRSEPPSETVAGINEQESNSVAEPESDVHIPSESESKPESHTDVQYTMKDVPNASQLTHNEEVQVCVLFLN